MIAFELSIIVIVILLIIVRDRKQSSFLFWFTCIVCILSFTYSIKTIFEDPESAGWDFHSYYYSALAFSKGIDPYHYINLFNEFGFSTMQFRYSPLTLYFFRIFNAFEFNESLRIYMIMKLSLYFVTILIWLVYVFKDYRLKTILLLIITFGFNKPYTSEFFSGNITVFEIFLLTVAIYFLLNNRVLFFSVIIVFLSLFKIQILPLIFLFLIDFDMKKLKVIISVLIVSAILFSVYYFLESAVSQSYINEIFNVAGEKGKYSPNYGTLLIISTYIVPLLKTISDYQKLNMIIYFFWVIIISSFSFYFFRKCRSKVSDMVMITYFIFVYALIIPRFADYTFMFLFVPAVYVIHYCILGNVLKSVVTLFICSAFLGHLHPIIAVYLLFVLYVIFFMRLSFGKISLPETDLSEKIIL